MVEMPFALHVTYFSTLAQSSILYISIHLQSSKFVGILCTFCNIETLSIISIAVFFSKHFPLQA